MDYKLIIFDLDGTLIDSLEDLTASLNFALDKCGLRTVSLDDTKNWIGKGLVRFLYMSIGEQVADEYFDILQQYFLEHYKQNLLNTTRCYAGIPKMLHNLDGHHKMGLFSNKHTQFIMPILNGLGIDNYFPIFFGGDNPYGRKPSSNAVLKIMEYFGVDKKETVFVGDMPVDIQTAKSAGIDVCVVTWGYGHNDQLEQLQPDFIAHSPHDLVPIIKG